MSHLDWFVVAAYVAGITALGLLANRQVHSAGDYFIGGRRFGWFKMMALAFATGTRTEQAVVVIGASAQVGLAGIWYQWIFLFATPFYWLIAPIYRRLRYLTIGDFFERRYGASMEAAYAVVGLAFFALSIGLILKATGITIEAVTQGGIPAHIAVLAMTVFFLVYGLFGGLVAVGLTHPVQGLFILILSFLLIPFALDAAGGLSGLRAALPDGVDWFSLVAEEEVTFFFIIMAVINALVGIVVQPHHMAINGAGKDEISCRSGWTVGTFIKRFTTIGWAFTGIFIAALLPVLIDVDAGTREQAFGRAVSTLLPAGLVGLMMAAMVAAVVAGCHTFMVNGSALFTRNFYGKYLRRNAPDHHYLSVARLSSLAVVAGGVVLGLYLPSVVAGLLLIWKLMAFMGIAFWGAVFWRRANRFGAWSSLVVAASLAFVSEGLGWSFPAQVALYLPAGILSLVVVSVLTRPEPEDRLNAFYSLLDTPVGAEHLLRAAGIDIIYERDEDATQTGDVSSLRKLSGAAGDGAPSEKVPDSFDRGAGVAIAQSRTVVKEVDASNGAESLLLVKLLSLHRGFSWTRFRADLRGFAVCWAVVAAYLALVFLLAYVCGQA